MKFHILIAALASLSTLSAGATTWPDKKITMVVPFPAGGSTDSIARIMAKKLSEKLDKNFVVENQPGAGGNLGTGLVARSAPNQQTIALSTSGPLANNKYLYKNIGYDPVTDLTPVSMVGRIPVALAVPKSSKINNLQDLFDAAKSKNGNFSVANPGTGTIGHLAAESIKIGKNIDFLNVPYKGDSPAINDLMGNVVDAVSMPITALIPQIKAERLKGIAVLAGQRIEYMPEMKTAAEQNFNLDASVWMALVGPKGMPEDVVNLINKEVNIILKEPEMLEKLAQFGAIPMSGTPKDLSDLMNSDSEKWKSIIKKAKVNLE